ncbi:hypothetical protein MYAM1_002846 [Malassezia yamatoensis]|uniref:Uncharacterized protein n=1 Tax=Malassezia yamatoensis TaxID=253288 RepID=A0AAJ5YTG9_9BASI|nr:hypothetical protein MYAM1_002846 [Malassezia yamatoensis]
MLGRRSVHTFTETIPRYAYARKVPAPVERRAPLPTRPRPLSQLRTPEQSSRISITPSIQSVILADHSDNRTLWRQYQGHPDVWAHQNRRAKVSATATALVALSLSLAIYYARHMDPLHTESADVMCLPTSTNSHMNISRAMPVLPEQLQFVRDAAQIGPI